MTTGRGSTSLPKDAERADAELASEAGVPGDHVVLAAKGGAVVFAGRLFVWGARFVLAVLLARLLGADQYGLYSIALTVATLGSAFSVIGLDSALVRYIAIYRRRGERPGVLGTLRVGLGLPMLASLVPAVALLVLAGPFAREVIGDPRLEPLLRIVALLVPAMVANSVLAATLQGAQRIGWAVVAEQFAQPISRFAILLVFIVAGLTAELAILASTLSTVVAAGLLLLFVNRHVSLSGVGTAAASERQLGTMLRFSLPVYFSNIVNTVGSNLQTLFLGAMASVASAGIFAVANQIMLIGAIFHAAIVQSSMAIFAELHDANDRARLKHLYQTTSKWTVTLNLPFVALALMFPQALLSLFGAEFLSGAPALALLGLATLANAATGSSGAVLDMTGHTRVKLLNSTLSVALAIALNLALIPPLGVIGAAIAVIGSVSSVNLLRLIEVRWLVGLSPYERSWLKPLAAGAGATAVALSTTALLADTEVAIQGAVGAALMIATYFVMLLGLGLSSDDRLVLSRARSRFTRRRSGRRRQAVGGQLASHPRSEVP
jgi:O-antigen/teichoic acid export membrane protein